MQIAEAYNFLKFTSRLTICGIDFENLFMFHDFTRIT